MGFLKSIGNAISKPFRSIGNAITGQRSMRRAQREADARAMLEADNPILTPEGAAPVTQTTLVDEQNAEDVQARKRKRVGINSSTSRGLTRVLGGDSTLG